MTMQNRSAMLASLLLLISAPRDASSFSAPRHHHRHGTGVRSNRLRIGTSFTKARTTTKARRTFQNQRTLAGSTESSTSSQLYAHLAYLDSLNAITSNPDLFPTTSDYIRTLSRAGLDDGSQAPSAEEFLTQLSTELLRASSSSPPTSSDSEPVVAAMASSAMEAMPAASASAPLSPLNSFAETMAPALTSAAGVYTAANGYDASSYSQLLADGRNGYIVNGYDADYTAASSSGYATEFAAATNAATVNGDDGSGFGTEFASAATNAAVDAANNELGVGDAFAEPSGISTAIADGLAGAAETASNAAEAAATATATATATTAAGPSESFASWHAQGGSNALRDLASSIPTSDVEQQDVSYVAQAAQQAWHGANTGNWYDPVAVTNSYTSSSLNVASAVDVSSAATEPSVAATVAMVDSAVSPSMPSDPVVTASIDTAPIESAIQSSPLIPEVNNEVFSNDLSSQLSDLSYEGMNSDMTNAATTASNKAPVLSDYIKSQLEKIAKDAEPAMQNTMASAKEVGSASKAKLGQMFDSMSHSFDGLSDRVADASNSFEGLSGHMSEKVAGVSNSLGGLSGQVSKAATAGVEGVRSIGDTVQSGTSNFGEGMAGLTSSVKSVGSSLPPPPTMPKVNLNVPNVKFDAPTLPHVDLPAVNIQTPPLPAVNMPNIPPPSLPTPVVEGTNAAMKSVGDASLSDFGNGVISAIKFTGGIMVKFLDFILNAVAGTSVASILTNVQTSVNSVIDNATHSVLSTINGIANMSVKEILQNLMALIIAITDILLKIMNAVIYLISGRDGENWLLQATTTVNEASSHLLAQASLTYHDITHASMAELAHNIGDYSQYVGNELYALMGSLNGAEGDILLSSLDGSSGHMLNADVLDGVAAAVQTAMNM